MLRRDHVLSVLLALSLASTLPGQQRGPARLRVSPSDLVIAPGGGSQFMATYEFFEGTGRLGGERSETTAVTWSSSDHNVATIDAQGVATASSSPISSPQSTTITATSGAFSVSVPLTVSNAMLSSISLTPANPSVPKGRSQQFVATGNYSDGTQHNLSDAVMWQVVTSSVASIDSLGFAKTQSVGSTSITATLGATMGMTTLTVGPAVLDLVEVGPENATAVLPATQQFTATGVLTDGTTQDLTSSATWNTSDSNVATISSSGFASASAPGSTLIFASSSGVTGSTEWQIIALQSIAIAPANPTIFFAATEQLTATGMYSDGSQQDVTDNSAWSSTDKSIASVNSTGVVRAIHEGSATVQASQRGVIGSTQVSVVPNVSISISPASAEVDGLAMQQFTAAVSGASNLAVTWQVNGITGGSSSVGAIDTTGLYRAPAAIPNPSTVDVRAVSVAQPTRSATAPVSIGPAVYLPLAVGNTWSYDCGGGTSITDTVTGTATVNGHSTFAMRFEFPQAPTQTFLMNNDAHGNTTLYGYLVNGTPVAITPAAYIADNPTTSESFNYTAQGGGIVQRRFVNIENTNPTPLGTFVVASYNDNGTQRIWGYTRGNGIMEQDHGAFDCKVKAFTVH